MFLVARTGAGVATGDDAVAPSDDANFQGIDPQQVQTLISSMGKGVSNGQPLAEYYLGQFNRLGLDTSAPNKLLADYGWASNQQPMLKRRYSLASHQPSGAFTDGWTDQGAGALTFQTTAAAQAAGTAEAKKLQQLIANRDWAGVQAEMDKISENGGDSDYAAALFKTLPPQDLYYLSGLAQGNSGNAQVVRDVIGTALASASYEIPLTQSYLEQASSPDNDPMAAAQYPGGFNGDVMAQFLASGAVFSSQWLNAISPYVLGQGGDQPVEPGTDQIFQAMANNPQFAAQFFNQHFEQLSRMMTNPVQMAGISDKPGFAAFAAAATIPPEGDTNTVPFQQNAVKMIQFFASSGDDTTDQIRQVMTGITINYWNDLTTTVTAAAPGYTSGMGVTAGQWGQFVQQAMKDKTSAAMLLTYYANWDTQPMDNIPKHGRGDNTDTPQHAGYWNDSSGGVLDYFFAANYKAAGATAGDSGSIEGIFKDALTAGTATVLTSLVFGPEGGAMALLTEGAKDAFSSATESTLGDIVDNFTADPQSDGTLDQDLTTIQGQWSKRVGIWWEQTGSTPGNPQFPSTYYNGLPYNGDPLPYEEQYGGYFMNSNGTLKSLSEIQSDPQKLAAYNAWLQDPAISAQMGPYFSVREGGALLAYYDTQVGVSP
jgi:hypothetical protein